LASATKAALSSATKLSGYFFGVSSDAKDNDAKDPEDTAAGEPGKEERKGREGRGRKEVKDKRNKEKEIVMVAVFMIQIVMLGVHLPPPPSLFSSLPPSLPFPTDFPPNTGAE
jgi:hypothetical protein